MFWLTLSCWFTVDRFLKGQLSHYWLGAVFGSRRTVSASHQWMWCKQWRALDHWVKHISDVHCKLSFSITVLLLSKYGTLSLRVGIWQQQEAFKMTAKAPTGLTSGVFILHSYLSFRYAEWWLNNMHYPRHQLQGSIIPVLPVGPGSPRSDGVSFPAHVADWRPNFHSWTGRYAPGKSTECGADEMGLWRWGNTLPQYVC